MALGLNLGQPHAFCLNKNYGYVNTMVLDNGVFFGLVLASLVPFMFGRFSQAQVGLKSKCPFVWSVLQSPSCTWDLFCVVLSPFRKRPNRFQATNVDLAPWLLWVNGKQKPQQTQTQTTNPNQSGASWPLGVAACKTQHGTCKKVAGAPSKLTKRSSLSQGVPVALGEALS